MNGIPLRWIAALFLLLAGCGGSGSETGTSPPRDTDAYAALQAQHQQLVSDQQSLSKSALGANTAIGSATYTGHVLYAEIGASAGNTPFTLAGDVTLDVTLSATQNSVTGRLRNFVDGSDRAYSGTLALSSGLIDRNSGANDYAISARLSGELTRSGASGLTADGGINADFLGPNFEMVSGTSFLDLQDGNDSRSLRGTLVTKD